MKLFFTFLFTSVSLFSICQYKESYRLIIYPSDERNHSIYDTTSKYAFPTNIQEFFESYDIYQNTGSLYYLSELQRHDLTHFDIKEVDLAPKNNSYPENSWLFYYFLSSDMDLYVIQKLDTSSNRFRDLEYHFFINNPMNTEYIEIIQIDADPLIQKTHFDPKIVFDNAKLYAVKDDFLIDSKMYFMYYLYSQLDFHTLQHKPMQSTRIVKYSEKYISTLINCGSNLLQDLKSNHADSNLVLYSKTDWKFFNFDRPFHPIFQYSDNEPRSPIMSLITGEDSLITYPDGTMVTQYAPGNYFDLKFEDLDGVLVYEQGTYNIKTQKWDYQPIAISPQFTVTDFIGETNYDKIWIKFSDIASIKEKLHDNTWWWFESVKNLKDGEITFTFEPK